MSELIVPDVGAILAPILARVGEADRPLLLAIAERMAAERYREWAAVAANGFDRDRLLACADREEEIATRIESLRADHSEVQAGIRQANPDIAAITRALFGGRPWQEQFTIQARGERLGAATWRTLASLQKSPEARETLLTCARLEEDSADVLEAMLAEHSS